MLTASIVCIDSLVQDCIIYIGLTGSLTPIRPYKPLARCLFQAPLVLIAKNPRNSINDRVFNQYYWQYYPSPSETHLFRPRFEGGNLASHSSNSLVILDIQSLYPLIPRSDPAGLQPIEKLSSIASIRPLLNKLPDHKKSLFRGALPADFIWKAGQCKLPSAQ